MVESEISKNNARKKAIEYYIKFKNDLSKTVRAGMETTLLFNPDIALRNINILLNYIQELEETYAHIDNSYHKMSIKECELIDSIETLKYSLEDEDRHGGNSYTSGDVILMLDKILNKIVEE